MRLLEIVTSVGCSVACPICPQSVFVKAYGNNEKFLSVETFKHVLSRLPIDIHICMSAFSEPFLNPKTITFLNLSVIEGRQTILNTTLSGVSPAEALNIANLRLHAMTVHVPDAHSQMAKIVNPQYLGSLKVIATERPNTRFMVFGPPHPEVLKILGNKIEQGSIVSRSSTLFQFKPWNKPLYCRRSRGIEHQVMMPDGTVVACCQDWGMRHRLGNLLTQTWDELQPEREKFIKLQQENPTACACNGCEEAGLL